MMAFASSTAFGCNASVSSEPNPTLIWTWKCLAPVQTYRFAKELSAAKNAASPTPATGR